MPLRDVLVPRPSVLFVGINPSLASEAAGHHFAGPRNPFWKLLHAARLTPEPLGHSQDRRLADFQMAITNLCPRATRSAAELDPAELERGKRVLVEKIRLVHPELVALVGVTLYPLLFGSARRGRRGPGLKPERFHGARLFVLPNPSGLNASFPSFASKLEWYARLREVLDSAKPDRPPPFA